MLTLTFTEIIKLSPIKIPGHPEFQYKNISLFDLVL